jgi:amino acid permease
LSHPEAIFFKCYIVKNHGSAGNWLRNEHLYLSTYLTPTGLECLWWRQYCYKFILIWIEICNACTFTTRCYSPFDAIDHLKKLITNSLYFFLFFFLQIYISNVSTNSDSNFQNFSSIDKKKLYRNLYVKHMFLFLFLCCS